MIIAAAVPLSSDALRRRIVAELSQRMNADIELGDLDLHLFPRLRASGGALKVRQHGDGDEPLISVSHFVLDADLLGVVRHRIAHVQLVGLKIVIPPKNKSRDASDAVATTGDRPQTDPSFEGDVVVDTLESTDAQLVIMPDREDQQKGKKPSIWAIHRLKMRDVGARSAMPFDATLTNAIPPGDIVTSGTFGPWKVEVPGDTPLAGQYVFDHADLNVFRGIGGTLSSRGTFGGALDYIDVNGETDTPDFVIDVGGHPFPMHTKFHTIVDGTNGNTYLKEIDVDFLKSSFVARGAVYDEGEHIPGRMVTLDIDMRHARIEDVMQMAVKASPPPMVGALTLQTRFELPPGDADVADRLRLDGRFTIAGARFTNMDVQAKIDELSQKSRGRTVLEQRNRVLSNFQGRFTLGAGKLKLGSLMFEVPGARVTLAGGYALKSEALDFRGLMLMDAKVSDTQSGFKRLLLKVVDPLFRRKDGKDGSAVPFKINGKRSDPQFGLDFGRVFKRGN
ncbi:MAG TPA: hypothetical protein VFA59_24765 [Vicinamibacterales bacterium]|nr:hypothetical protein [Vicinamibacterales bacterium]